MEGQVNLKKLNLVDHDQFFFFGTPADTDKILKPWVVDVLQLVIKYRHILMYTYL